MFNKEFYRSSNFWGGLVALVLSGWGFSPLTGNSVYEIVVSVILVVIGIYELSRGLFVPTRQQKK
ncbi:hypothetical protein [Levilactobacillus angrenensis]|uniref:Uncharacterized protein n=1 Tax=Levilactobacillus angrenensis TaxID=2486020 RepID=A0ABW1U6K5_9LACO|nr:hypothetical protein [Levilactobacillus angrenensis]